MARTFTVNEVSRMLIQSLKVLSKTISWLSMFSKIGKLRVRKTFVYLSRGVCPKTMMFTVCKLLKNSLKTWTAFPQMSDCLTKFVQEVAKDGWSRSSSFVVMLTSENDYCNPES